MLVRGALVLITPARPAYVTFFRSFASYVRLCPSSDRPCTSGPSLHLPLTTSEWTFHLPTEWAGSEPFSHASIDEEYRFQCPRALQPEPWSKSSSIYSNTLLDLSSTKSYFTCTQRKPGIRRYEEYPNFNSNRRTRVGAGAFPSQSPGNPLTTSPMSTKAAKKKRSRSTTSKPCFRTAHDILTLPASGLSIPARMVKVLERNRPMPFVSPRDRRGSLVHGPPKRRRHANA